MTTHLPSLGLADAARGIPGIKVLEISRSRRRRTTETPDIVDTRPESQQRHKGGEAKFHKAAKPARRKKQPMRALGRPIRKGTQRRRKLQRTGRR